MAHLIDMSNSRANMAFVGATPWHGLGQQLQAGADLAQWAQAAGMDWHVERAAVQYQNGQLRTFAGKEVLYRSDTSAPLGVVSDGYKIVQPGECLEFFADLCSEQGMQLETAGVLKGGALYWALARTGHTLSIAGDTTNGFVLLSTSADGSRATDARLTSVRVVCNNTLSVAMSRNSKSAVKTRHSTTFDHDATKKKLGLVSHDDAWAQFSDQMNRLAQKTVTNAEAQEFFSELLRPAGERAKPRANMGAQSFSDLLNAPIGVGTAKTATDKAPVDRAIRGLEDLMQSYYRAPGAVPGTAYGMVQGVTHFIDHVRGSSNDKRLTSAWFGQGDTLKTTAMQKALELV